MTDTTVTPEAPPAAPPVSATQEPPLVQYVDYEQFKKDLKFDITNLSEAMAAHAGHYAFYASQAVRAKRQSEVNSKKVEILSARLVAKYRAAFKDRGEKATEAQISSAVTTDSIYIAACMREINAREIYDLARSCERSFDQQKDMLLQIARDAAREGAGSLRVVANQANQERARGAFLEAAGANVAAA